MAEKTKVGYLVDTSILEEFNKKADEVGISGAKFVASCMKAYAEDMFRMLDGVPYFSGSEVSITPIIEKRAPGRPPSSAKPVVAAPVKKKLNLQEEQYQAYKFPGSIPPSERTLASYYHPDMAEGHDHIDPRESLALDTPNSDGTTFKDYIKDNFLIGIEYMKAEDADDWFDYYLEGFIVCVANKFLEDNKLDTKYRYRKDDVWNDIVVYNSELMNTFDKETDELFKIR